MKNNSTPLSFFLSIAISLSLGSSLHAGDFVPNGSKATKSIGIPIATPEFFIETSRELDRVSGVLADSIKNDNPGDIIGSASLLNVDQQYLNLSAPKRIDLSETQPDDVIQVNDNYFEGLFSLNETLKMLQDESKNIGILGQKLKYLVEEGQREISNSYKLSEMFVRISIGRCIDLHYKTVSIDHEDKEQTANNHYQFINDCYNHAINLSPEAVATKWPKAVLDSKLQPQHCDHVVNEMLSSQTEGSVEELEKAYKSTLCEQRKRRRFPLPTNAAEQSLIFKSQAMYGLEFSRLLMKNYMVDKTPKAKAIWLLRTIAYYSTDLSNDMRVYNDNLKKAIYQVVKLQRQESYGILMRYFRNGGHGLGDTQLAQLTNDLYARFVRMIESSSKYIYTLDQINERSIQSVGHIRDSLY